MVDPVTSATSTTGPFDTAAMQIAQAQAQAAAAHTNEAAFLQEIAKTNDETNAHALDSTDTTPATDAFLSNALVNLDPSVDPNIDPAADPATLSLFSEFGADLTAEAASDSLKSQQMHDIAILQKDAVLLEEAANENSHIALGSGASTVDLSTEAQGLVSGITVASINGSASLTSAQLAQAGNILTPVASQPLTPALLQQIQAQLDAQQNPIQLSLNAISLIINFIAGLQPNPNHMMEGKTGPHVDHKVTVKPVTSIDKVAVEDSAILT